MSNWAVATGPGAVSLTADTGLSVSAGDGAWSAWVEVSAALPFSVGAFHFYWTAGVARRVLVEIGVGSAGSEVAVARVVWLGPLVTQVMFSPAPRWIPVAVAQGQRVAIRARTVGGMGSMVTHISASAPSVLFPVGVARFTPLGITESTVEGVPITPGSVDTWSAWTQIVAGAPHAALALMASVYNTTGTGWGNTGVLFEVGVGSAGNEVAVFRGYSNARYDDWPVNDQSLVRPCSIPAGARIAARIRGTSTLPALTVVPTLIG